MLQQRDRAGQGVPSLAQQLFAADGINGDRGQDVAQFALGALIDFRQPGLVEAVSQGADASGRLTYYMQTLNGNLITNARQTSATLASTSSSPSDVYIMMLSFRYTFQ